MMLRLCALGWSSFSPIALQGSRVRVQRLGLRV